MEFKSINHLLETLRNDGEIDTVEKLKMVTNYRDQWGEKMGTNIQSSDQLIENNETLKRLNDEVKYYSV